jgi:hypothetical protein
VPPSFFLPAASASASVGAREDLFPWPVSRRLLHLHCCTSLWLTSEARRSCYRRGQTVYLPTPPLHIICAVRRCSLVTWVSLPRASRGTSTGVHFNGRRVLHPRAAKTVRTASSVTISPLTTSRKSADYSGHKPVAYSSVRAPSTPGESQLERAPVTARSSCKLCQRAAEDFSRDHGEVCMQPRSAHQQ